MLNSYEKANSRDRGPAAKANVASKDVDEYLAGIPEPARSTLNKVRAAIRSAVSPEATEAISYLFRKLVDMSQFLAMYAGVTKDGIGHS